MTDAMCGDDLDSTGDIRIADHRRCGTCDGDVRTVQIDNGAAGRVRMRGEGSHAGVFSTDLETKGVPTRFTCGLARLRDCNYVVLRVGLAQS